MRLSSLIATDPGRYALDKGTEADELDQWSKQRDDYLSTYASAGRNYTQSPYQYGVSDLNYYGQYYDVPGYGNVWQPNGVGLWLGPIQQRLLELLAGLWIYLGLFVSLGMDALPLRPLGVCRRPWLVLGAGRMEQMV